MSWRSRRCWRRAHAIRRAARLLEEAYAEQSACVRKYGIAGFGLVYTISRAIMSLGDKLTRLTRDRMIVARDLSGNIRRFRRRVPR